eukprot:CAMPEP_0177795924 /NCGR_PEP_ID=MMETSP0491_2-20121128/26499_1 /TAXON_ID=63592 /ORGANISM="Tetraselmis chuii, Strain PLY429" /LENGTH=136 /DNA_ID=CAMNT_0019318801 /DNA_START=328 /DNA_END=739 /DNA_ORIENTATION=+
MSDKPLSTRAARAVVTRQKGDRVDFICVTEGTADSNVDSSLVASIREEILSMCLEDVGDKLVNEIPYEVHVVTGSLAAAFVVDAVVDVSRKLEASLVVVGTHGRGRLQEFFLGSVASGLLRNCPVSVAVVRPPETT